MPSVVMARLAIECDVAEGGNIDLIMLASSDVDGAFTLDETSYGCRMGMEKIRVTRGRKMRRRCSTQLAHSANSLIGRCWTVVPQEQAHPDLWFLCDGCHQPIPGGKRRFAARFLL